MGAVPLTTAERQELASELDYLSTHDLVRNLARRLRVKAATLKQKSRSELIEALIDAGPPSVSNPYVR